jgi:hypothetical protein
MSDDLKDRGVRDRDRVNVNEEHEVRYWGAKFGVSAQRLKEAVAKVGPMAADVERELQER